MFSFPYLYLSACQDFPLLCRDLAFLAHGGFTAQVRTARAPLCDGDSRLWGDQRDPSKGEGSKSSGLHPTLWTLSSDPRGGCHQAWTHCFFERPSEQLFFHNVQEVKSPLLILPLCFISGQVGSYVLSICKQALKLRPCCNQAGCEQTYGSICSM